MLTRHTAVAPATVPTRVSIQWKSCCGSCSAEHQQYRTLGCRPIYFRSEYIGKEAELAWMAGYSLNPLMHKVAKMVTWNNGVRRHTGLTRGFWPTVLSVVPLARCVVCRL